MKLDKNLGRLAVLAALLIGIMGMVSGQTFLEDGFERGERVRKEVEL